MAFRGVDGRADTSTYAEEEDKKVARQRSGIKRHGQIMAVTIQRQRSLYDALLRGARHKCPACGRGSVFRAYLKVADSCAHCGEALHHHRADDAPPYLTITIVGHLVVAGVLVLERAAAPPQWLHLALWLPLTVVLSLVLLPTIKGSIVGLQWANGMHGFGAHPDPDEIEHEPAHAPSST